MGGGPTLPAAKARTPAAVAPFEGPRRGPELLEQLRPELLAVLVADGLVLDGAGHATEVTGNIFLRASRWFIEAPDLAAGGNYWATADASAATAKVKGRISVLPWKPASAAGY